MDGIKQNVNYFIMDGTMVVHPLLFHQTSFVVLQNISKILLRQHTPQSNECNGTRADFLPTTRMGRDRGMDGEALRQVRTASQSSRLY
jgi:hypothetical protein